VERNKRGVFFSIDALIAVTILIITLLFIFPTIKYPSYESSIPSDVMNTFSQLKIGEINNSYVKSLISAGLIINLNNSILEQIGEFYVTNLTIAKNLGNSIFSNLNTSENIGIWYEDVLIASKNSTSFDLAENIEIDKQVISGIKSGGSVTGYSARAFLSKSSPTKYFYFGGYVGDGNVSINLSDGGDVSDVNIEIAVNKDFDIYINGIYSGHYQNSSSTFIPSIYNLGAYIDNFNSESNIIKITGEGVFVAGGNIKVNYNNLSLIQELVKYRFPGIEGIINLYDGFYIPGTIKEMKILLHLNSGFETFLTIGNITVFNSSTIGEQTILINNSVLTNLLDYNLISNKTIPLRLGMKNISIAFGGKSDAVLITDRTSSMNACDVSTNCTGGLCDNSLICHDRRVYVAQNSDRQFVNEMLSVIGNSVGLVGYGEWSNPVCSFLDITNDNETLQNRIDDYDQGEWCGWTCTSCGIYSATQMLIENKKLYGVKIISDINDTQFHVGDSGPVNVNETLSVIINKSSFVKSRLTILGREVDTESDYRSCVFINGNYLGRMCESNDDQIFGSDNQGWHTCSYAIKPEWLNELDQEISITGANKQDCFGTSGQQDDWDFKEVELKVWEYENVSMNQTSFFDGTLVNLDDGNEIRTLSFNTGIDPSLMKSAYLNMEIDDVNPSYFDCVFVNNNFIGRMDYQHWSAENEWQETTFEVPVMALNNSNIDIKITSGTDDGCELTSGANDGWDHRNVNLTIYWGNITNVSSYDRLMSMLIMSDGDANTKIGHRRNYDPSEADTVAVEKACEAFNTYGIRIYTVAFGDGADISAMNDIAACDDISHAYNASNAGELVEIYKKIANEIIELDFSEQSTELAGNVTVYLYPDSYIEFNYSETSLPFGLTITSEQMFTDAYFGSFNLPSNSTIVETNVISYSGSRWTNSLEINNISVYNLSEYELDYINLGDPYRLNVPNLLVNNTNLVWLTTGVEPLNSTFGSTSNKIIYSVIKDFQSFSTISAMAEGCLWDIEFEDDTNITIGIPFNYSGSNNCNYKSSGIIYDSNDAIQSAVNSLLVQLDFDINNKIDIKFAEDNFLITSNEIIGIPYGWSTDVFVGRWN